MTMYTGRQVARLLGLRVNPGLTLTLTLVRDIVRYDCNADS